MIQFFANRTVPIHLARGLIGLTALTAAPLVADANPLGGIALMTLGLVSLKGCPLCWTVGLILTLSNAIKRGTRSLSRAG